jgi:CheY-like chemotaxis protein
VADLAALWSSWSNTILHNASAPIRVAADHPLAAPSWAHVAAYAQSRELALDLEPHDPDRANRIAYVLDPWTYRTLVKTLGDVITTAVAQRTGRPIPPSWAVPGLTVLWADDNPMNNATGIGELEKRGIRVLHALDTEAALATLAIEPVVVVISDMGRPPDAHAGYTLLTAMREQGYRQPFLIYARAPEPEHLDEARRRGAFGTTDSFDELLQSLRELLIDHGPEAVDRSTA